MNTVDSFSRVGNPLGSARAETDKAMLAGAFVETHDFKALISTNDFSFVVGRRGTGKTALYLKVSEHFSRQRSRVLLHKVKPEEYEVLQIRSAFPKNEVDYRSTRAIARVCWRSYLLTKAAESLMAHWKIKRSLHSDFLTTYCARHQVLLTHKGLARIPALLDHFAGIASSVSEIPGLIARQLELESLQEAIDEALKELHTVALFLFDGLDEGWTPSAPATAVLGGLCSAVADLQDRGSEVRGVLFIRDNMARSLAHFDPDYSRHIEGSSIRLSWNQSSLLHLVAGRLRLLLNLQKIDSDIKVWNRFAQRELQGREGFGSCLRHTLYRPRDVLVLLNRAHAVAARSGREEIVGEDIEYTARDISLDRLADLIKEYDSVFPGLRLIVQEFNGWKTYSTVAEVTKFLEKAVQEQDFSSFGASDYAVLESGQSVLFALYSVGFLGIEDAASRSFIFCHDGSRAGMPELKNEQRVVVHPCYWRALDMNIAQEDPHLVTEVPDEYDVEKNPELLDIRTHKMGQILSEFPSIPTGRSGAKDYERWVLRSLKIILSGNLKNFDLHANPSDAVQQRDIIATNMGAGGFWKRVLSDYEARQVVFEVKNYAELKAEDFRQVLSYSSEGYGRFAIIVNRAETEGLSDMERGWVKELWHNHKRIVMVLPGSALCRCIGKWRSGERRDYVDDLLNKRLDVIMRSYLAIRHEKQVGRKKKRKRG